MMKVDQLNERSFLINLEIISKLKEKTIELVLDCKTIFLSSS